MQEPEVKRHESENSGGEQRVEAPQAESNERQDEETRSNPDDENNQEDSDVEDDLTGKHPLQFRYVLWFNRRVQGARTQENYEKNIKKVGSFASVEDFWDHYSFVIRANDLPNTSDYHLFKKGIKPMWEDDANKTGGKWILRLRKGLASKYWEDLVLAIIGEQFDVGNEICGAVVSIRYQEDIISLWNRTCSDNDTKLRIVETMKRVLSLKDDARLEYKNHDASIRDNSSFRNTEAIPGGLSASGTILAPALSASNPIPNTEWLREKRFDKEDKRFENSPRFDKPIIRGPQFNTRPRPPIQQPR